MRPPFSVPGPAFLCSRMHTEQRLLGHLQLSMYYGDVLLRHEYRSTVFQWDIGPHRTHDLCLVLEVGYVCHSGTAVFLAQP